MLWREKENSRVRSLQIDNLRGLLGIRKMDRVQNARVREFCGVRKTTGAGGGEPGTVDEDVSDGQSSVAAGTHRSRPAGHIVPVSQPRVS